MVSGGKTILMVTHDDDLAERATRTVVISDGMITDDIRHVNALAPLMPRTALPAPEKTIPQRQGGMPVLQPGVGYA